MKEYFYLKLKKYNILRWLVLIIDIYIVANTFLLAYLIRFNFQFTFDTSHLFIQIPCVIAAAFIAFVLIGSYKGVIRHAGIKGARNVTYAASLIFVILTAAVYFLRVTNLFPNFTIPLSILIIHFLLNGFFLIVSRFVIKKLYRLLITTGENETKVLIYGAGDSGIITYNVLSEDTSGEIKVVGFLDDSHQKIGKKINGLPVYNPSDITLSFIENRKIEEIIISIQNVTSDRLLEISNNMSDLPVTLKILPPVTDWINDDLQVQQIKRLKIEDLLGRKPIRLNNPLLHHEFNDKVVLVTGAAGSIGSEIARQVATYNYRKLILIDQAESDLYNLQQHFINKGLKNITSVVADVRNKARIESIIKECQPQIIFHAAAYKHVPFMEDNPYEAVNVNIMGTKNLADLAQQYKVEKFVLISTDKAVNPTNVMGASKRIAEMYITSIQERSKTKFITTRFGNVLGSNGSVIPLFKSQIKNGGPLTVTHKDITRYFMTIPEACQLVLEAGTMGKGGEIFVFDMGKSIKIYDLALNMIHLSGLKFPEDIDIKITGLRPGEKIYEELLGDGESTLPTHHEKIMIALVKKINFEEVLKHIISLCEANQNMNQENTVSVMKKIVPEYISNNSPYGMLD